MENVSSLKEHLLQLEEKLLQSEIRTSPTEVTKLLADDFFEFGSSGHVWYKRDGISENGIGVVNAVLSDFEIYPLSNGTVLATNRIFNKDKKQHTLRSSIWRYRDGRWQMFFHQGTMTNSY